MEGEGALGEVSHSEVRVQLRHRLVGVATGGKWAELRLATDTLVEYGPALVSLCSTITNDVTEM